MSGADWVLLGIIATAAGAAIFCIRRAHRQGRCIGCTGACAGCKGCGEPRKAGKNGFAAKKDGGAAPDRGEK